MCPFMLCVKNNLVISMLRHHWLLLSWEGGVGWGYSTSFMWGGCAPRQASAAWLAQLGEPRSTEREVAGSNPGRTNTQGL